MTARLQPSTTGAVRGATRHAYRPRTTPVTRPWLPRAQNGLRAPTLGGLDDPTLIRFDLEGLEGVPLPHAWLRAGLLQMVEDGYTPEFLAAYKRVLVDLSRDVHEIDAALVRECAAYAGMAPAQRALVRGPREWEYALRLHWTRSPTLMIRPGLLARLRETDIGLSVPGEMFRTPFPLCYLQFASAGADDASTVLDGPQGAWRLEGAFVHVMTRSEGARVSIHAIGPLLAPSPSGGDSMAVELGFTVSDRGRPLREALDLSGPSPYPASLPRDLVDSIAKAVLYMGLREARLVARPERTQALQAARTGCADERRAAARRARRLIDWIDVGPEEDRGDPGAPAGGRTVPAHVRRGHFHRYWTGHGRSVPALRWLPPLVVNARRLAAGTDGPAPRDYRVR